jgi:hypothetical protein
VTEARIYTTRRQNIVDALVGKLKLIDGEGAFLTNLECHAYPHLKFWDEIEEFPAVHVNSGLETRDYQGGGYKDRYLQVTIRVYVKEEDSVRALDALLEDIETVVETYSSLEYTDKQGAPQRAKQITIDSIDTDEGVLSPLGVGEMQLTVHY